MDDGRRAELLPQLRKEGGAVSDTEKRMLDITGKVYIVEELYKDDWCDDVIVKVGFALNRKEMGDDGVREWLRTVLDDMMGNELA